MRTMLIAAASLALAGGWAAGAPANAEIVHTVYGPRPVVSFGHGVSAQQHLVLRAAALVRELKADTSLGPAVRLARGVVVVPGAAPGAPPTAGADSVALARNGGAAWTGPAFYDSEGVRGPMVLVLLTDRALARFAADGGVTLGHGSGLRIVDARDARRHGIAGADAILWTQPDQPAGPHSLAHARFVASAPDSDAYYDQSVAPREVLGDRAPNPHAEELWHALEG